MKKRSKDYPGVKSVLWLGRSIKEDNGSGLKISDKFPGRRFHDGVTYRVKYHGVWPDAGNIFSITRARTR
jgi:hypothetical protein